MPKGEDYSIKEKQIMFRVIEFVEREKTGAIIPLYNTSNRLLAMLGISESSLFKLKKEIVDQRQKEQDEQEKQQQQQLVRTRRQTTSSVESSRSHRKRRWSTISQELPSAIPTPLPSKKAGSSGRPKIRLSELAEDTIRYHFHLLLVSSLASICYQQIISLLLGRENISHSGEGTQPYSQ